MAAKKNAGFGEIIHNTEIAENIFDMRISCRSVSESARPGQFVNIYVPRADLILPRPISVCETYPVDGTFGIVYQVIGEGTKIFAALKSGDSIKLTGPVGNGFIINEKNIITIVGGGLGVPPLLFLANEIIKTKSAGLKIFLGFRSAAQMILIDEFKKLPAGIFISTDDGSFGFHGNVVEQIRAERIETDMIYACGPKPMLRAVAEYAAEKNIACSVSLEERMACGLGACLGCAVKVKSNYKYGYTYKRACVDGPVFDAREVIWDD